MQRRRKKQTTHLYRHEYLKKRRQRTPDMDGMKQMYFLECFIQFTMDLQCGVM